MKRSKAHIYCFLKRHWLWLFLVAAMVVAFEFGMERIFSVNFESTNGDYQNYNALRRFLDGQIPYRDFANYLGMGLLVLCAPFLALHNSFVVSLFATNVVTVFLYVLFVAMIFYLVTGKRGLSVLAGLMFPKLFSAKLFAALPIFGYYTDYYVGLCLAPQGSFHLGRMSLALLLCTAALLGCRHVHRASSGRLQANTGLTLRGLLAVPRVAAMVGFVVGLGLTWSNDYGFACIGSTSLVLLILAVADGVQKRDWKKAFLRFLWYLPALLLGMLVSILLASRGHLASWFSYTFDVADWQYWFFGENVGLKLTRPSQLFTSKVFRRTLLHLLFYLLCMGYCLYRLCQNKAGDRLILFVYLFTSIMAAHILYLVGSGVDHLMEPTYNFVIVLFWAALAKAVLWLCEKWRLPAWRPLLRYAIPAVTAIYVCFMGLQDVNILHSYQAQAFPLQENYLPALEGVHPDATALREMEDIVGEETMFSTFATALDDMRGSFQVSGCDYSIHALGQKGRQAYLQSFRQQDCTWVQTTNTPWESWIQRAAWDIYREIFSDYRFHSEHADWVLWEKVGADAFALSETVQLQTQTLANGAVRLTVTGQEQRPCYVDVTLNWRSQRNKGAPLVLREVIFVEDRSIGENTNMLGYFRPAVVEDQHLVILMQNGKGEIELQPLEGRRVEVSDAKVEQVILDQTA